MISYYNKYFFITLYGDEEIVKKDTLRMDG